LYLFEVYILFIKLLFEIPGEGDITFVQFP